MPFIDWQFFFAAWELKGRFPKIFDDPKIGKAAKDLYDNAQKLLKQIVDGKLIRARGVYGFWPANSDGDDVVLWSAVEPGRPKKVAARFPMLRQQEVIADDKPNRSLADFVAPIESGVTDYVGAFAVTAGLGVDELVKKFEAQHDDYSAIIVKAIADRFAEAFAEYLHARARQDWGFGDALSNDDLIEEKYRGIRPAFGYPACPDHSEKGRLFELLGARSQGLDLTESYAMTPAASVSGLYFGHPQLEVFCDSTHRTRPGRGLREAQEHVAGRGGALAPPGARVRTGARRSDRLSIWQSPCILFMRGAPTWQTISIARMIQPPGGMLRTLQKRLRPRASASKARSKKKSATCSTTRLWKKRAPVRTKRAKIGSAGTTPSSNSIDCRTPSVSKDGVRHVLLFEEAFLVLAQCH